MDAHLEVGLGPGSTWRTAVFRNLPLAVLRIDYVLTSRDARPVAVDTDCAVTGSDHCRLSATLEIREQ